MRDTKPLPGSAHANLEQHQHRNKQLLGVQSRKGIGAKGHFKRVKTMRPGSRHPNRNKSANLMLKHFLKLAGHALPEDKDKTSGDAFTTYYAKNEKKNKAGTKADEATEPDGKEEMGKESAFWEGFCKIARSHGLSNLQTLGMCAVFEGRQGPGPSDGAIHQALRKIAMEDGEGAEVFKEMAGIAGPAGAADVGLAEGMRCHNAKKKTDGSPLQNVQLAEERELEERETDLDMQYSGDGPLDTQDPKEAAFRLGFREHLRGLASFSQGLISH